MTLTYSITGITCNGCAGHVKEQIEKHPDITLVDIPHITLFFNILLKPKKAVISMNQLVPLEELQLFLDKDSKYAGKYSISQAK